MDTPRIQYAKSADGTRIAFCVLGQGPPLIMVNNFYLTIEIIWEIPEVVANIERLRQTRTVVLYDARGAGLSRQEVSDFSTRAGVADLAAVAEVVDPGPVDVMCPGSTTAIGVTFAAEYPAKVRKLALHLPVVRGTDLYGDERRELLAPLGRVDWPFYLQCLALINYGWTDVGRRVSEKQAREASRGVWARSSEEWVRQDVTSVLPLVKCPTLVLDRRDAAASGAEASGSDPRRRPSASTEVAAAIPNARLARFSQDHPLALASSWDSFMRIVDEFFDEDLPGTESSTIPSGTAIILFADIVDSTALTEQMGDAAFRKKARGLDDRLREVIREAGGTTVEGKLLGDGVLAVFTSARQAIEAALKCGAAGDEGGLPLHLGIHAGDVIEEDGNVFGGAVNIAARIAGESAAGEVLVSATVRELARTSSGVVFEDAGERTLKGVSDVVHVWRVVAA